MADRRICFAAVLDDPRQVVHRLDVVDRGRAAPQALLGRERRADRDERGDTFDRAQQRGLFAADVRTLAAHHSNVARAEQPGLARGREGLLEHTLRGRVLLARVDERLLGTGRVGGDQDALDLRVGVSLDQLLVDVRARVALVEIDDDELAAGAVDDLAVAHGLQLDAGWKSSATAAPQAAGLDLIDDRLRGHVRDGPMERGIDATLARSREAHHVVADVP